MRQVGAAWRAAAIELSDAPDQVVDWWKRLHQSRDVAVAGIRDNAEVCTALLQLSATADEASLGVGLPPSRDGYDVLGWIVLDSTGSLSQRVDPEIVRVLPKCHTPQVGMTIRSLSHHLSLSSGNDVEPKWYMFKPHRTEPALNLLLVPWPKTLLPGDFRRADGPLKNMDSPAFGFFTYGSRRPVDPAYVNGLFEYAQTLVPSVDGVIFPEQSVTESEYERLKDLIVVNKKAFLMAGVGAPAGSGKFGSNYVRFDAAVRIDDDDHDERAGVEPQHKHHRWCLTGPQIGQYGLGRSLDPKTKWWECIDISKRKLAFVSLEPWLTLSVLICEDLARQDPVSELVRSVGPNLVIALLLDGPQLAARWPARYATVLADDPGSSVLTLTSVGMVDLCRGPRRVLESRPVALWKDALTGGLLELNLPAGADALLLCLGAEYREEWTADGRSDAYDGTGMTSYLTLTCVHPIPAPQVRPAEPAGHWP